MLPDPPENHDYDPPKDFHLAKPGSKDYVAGQPVDEAELKKVDEEAQKKRDEAAKAAAAVGTAKSPPAEHQTQPMTHTQAPADKKK